MSLDTLTIERRFHGPPDSGNGGYVCGRLAEFIDGDAAVRLNVPPPLETEMAVHRLDGAVELRDAETVVAQGRGCSVDLAVPDAPTFDEAVKASADYVGFKEHVYPTCFVCGPKRDPADGLCIFPGAVPERDLVAAPWLPHETLCGDSGVVADHFVWSALDCPGAFAFSRREGTWTVLGELFVHIDGQVHVNERCVLAAWHLGSDGRKHYAGSALFNESGDAAAVAKATWVELKR